MVYVHFLLKAITFSVMVLKFELKILLIAIFYACNWLFDSFILAEELISKALVSLETYVLVNNKLFGKLFQSLEPPTIFEEIFKVTSVSFFIPDFNLLIWELDNLTFKVLYWVLY